MKNTIKSFQNVALTNKGITIKGGATDTAPAQDYNSTRSNRAKSIADTAPAQDYNSTRSNRAKS